MPIAQVDISVQQWAELRAAASVLGIREAARQFAADQALPDRPAVVERIRKRAQRQHWIPHHSPLALPAPTPAQSPVQSPHPSQDAPQHPENKPTLPPVASPSTPPLVTGAEMIQRVLAKRREKSALYLSHYAVSATRALAQTKGDLKHTGTASELARVRSQLWPEAQMLGTAVEVTLNDKEQVAQIHARLITQLNEGSGS